MPARITGAAKDKGMETTEPIEHVKALCAEIGPRGPTTEAEARAAAYAAARLEQAGARQVSVETFRSVPSLWWALEIASALPLVSTVLYYWTGGEAWEWSVLLCLAALFILAAELNFWRVSLSNILPKRVSQNVYGRVPPKTESRKKLVIIGHLDTNRTPILFRSRLVRHLPLILMGVIISVVLKVMAFLIGTAVGARGVVLGVSLLLDIPIVAVLGAMVHGDLLSPFTEGANDNATGAAMVLSLGEFFVRHPLEQTEYWPLCTGCEEATLTGIRSFLDRHGKELQDAYFVDLECLGIGKLRYITYEGILKKCYSNPGLVRAAADAAEQIGEHGIAAMPLKRGYTETTMVLKKGLKGITIMAIPAGRDEVPHWHQVSDRIENIDSQALNRAMRYLVALARELDSE
jgi:hypothetical protein